MEFRLCLVGLLLAMAAVAECSLPNQDWLDLHDRFVPYIPPVEANDIEGLDPAETLMDSEISRRHLAAARYISYGALKKNSVPCNRRGQSYYNCNKMKRANPYRRGCSVITHCKRFTD